MSTRVYRLMPSILLILGWMAVSSPALGGSIRLQDGKLSSGGSEFVLRGIAYSNVPIGYAPSKVPSSISCLWARDLPLIAAAGANTIRTLTLLPEGSTAFFSLLESNNLYWLADFPLDGYYDPSVSLSSLREKILNDFRTYASRYQGQPRLIGYVFGDEVTRHYSTHFAGSVSDFDDLLTGAAAVLSEIDPDSKPLLTTAVRSTSEIRGAVQGLDFWSWNAADSGTFTASVEDVKLRAELPVLVSAFGIDALDATDGLEDEDAQATNALYFIAAMENAGDLLGGVYNSFSDEWWRAGEDPSAHSTDGVSDAGSPDGLRNPAWSGIFRTSRSEIAGLDSLQPRLVFQTLANLWEGRIPAEFTAEGDPQLNSLIHAATGESTAAPGALVLATGTAMIGASTVSDSSTSWPLHLGTTSVCAGSVPAPLGLASPESLTAQVPWDIDLGEQSVVTFRAGRASNPASISLAQYAPGVFPDGVIRAGTTCSASVANGVRPQEILEVYATGLGQLNDSETVTASINGTPAEVLYAGLLPYFVGMNQVNLRVGEATPASTSAGLVLSVDGTAGTPYSLSVASSTVAYGTSLTYGGGEIVLQAGAASESVTLGVEGVNGYCGPVLFSSPSAPEGVSFQASTAYTGEAAVLTVSAKATAPSVESGSLVISGRASGVSSSRVTIPVTVLPSQGEIPVRVISGGYKSVPLARVDWNGRTLYSTAGGGPGRGINIISVNPSTGVFSSVQNFDTWEDETASTNIIRYLAGLPDGTLILAAIADEGTYLLSQDARNAFAILFGSTAIESLGYQESWALISRKNAGKPIAEASSSDSQVVLDKVLTLPFTT